MINRALTSTFDLPQEQQFRQGGGGSRQPSGSAAGQPKYDDAYFGFGDIAEGLQYTEGIAKESEKYYQEREKLKQFARTNWLNNRIDVTSPDTSNPAAVRAAQIYQMGLANLNFQGDKLKESQKAFTRKDTLADQGLYAFEQGSFDQPMAMNTPEQSGYFTGLSPTMAAAQKAVNQNFTNYGQFQQAQGIQGSVQDAAKQAAIGGTSRQKLEAQQAGVIFNPDYTPPAPRDGGGDGVDSSVSGTVTDIARLANGTHESFKLTDKLGKEGSKKSASTNNVLINKEYGEYQDEKGVPRPFIIARLEKDNDTGEVTAFTAGGQSKVLPKKNIDLLIRDFLKSNDEKKKYNQYLETLIGSGAVKKIQGEGGAESYEVDADIFSTKADREKTIAQQQEAQAVKPLTQEVRKRIEANVTILDSSNLNKAANVVRNALPFSQVLLGDVKPSILQFNTENGKLQVSKKGDKYEVKLDGKVKDFGTENSPMKTVTKSQLIDILQGYGADAAIVFDKSGKVIAQPTTQQTPAAFDPTKF